MVRKKKEGRRKDRREDSPNDYWTSTLESKKKLHKKQFKLTKQRESTRGEDQDLQIPDHVCLAYP
jgi:hypothetical protein